MLSEEISITKGIKAYVLFYGFIWETNYFQGLSKEKKKNLKSITVMLYLR